ncbi:Bax inhibitor-1/YccA family membrane protein [Streptomyces sp. 2A115]|uniref:Bax inhibitor-1/YccA family membrane protein n=1 Tax=Streptomyces sp. 2A115 TaxID=3457439 RepID=UPI003FD218B0
MTPVQQQPSLKSSNPILSRPQFRRHGGQKTAAKDPRAGIAVAQSRIGTGQDLDQVHEDDPAPLPFSVGDLMTMDDVLSRALAGLGVTALAAALSWTLLPHAPIGTAVAYGIAAGAGLVAAALVVIQCRRKPPSATLTLTFAAFQGVCLGVLSATVSRHLSPGVFVQTVLGTMTTSAGALLAYKLHWMRVDRRLQGFVGAALLGLCFLALADLTLFPLTGAEVLGLRPAGLGVFMGLVGIVLAASFLPLHFRKIEDGIKYGAPPDQSWLAAFGLTLSLSWLYVETVRLLTLFRGEELF